MIRLLATLALLLTPIFTLAQNAEPANEKIKAYAFLADMQADAYFPSALVDKGKSILLELCAQIETETPAENTEVYALTHAATEKFNALNTELLAANSEIETTARENIARDIDFVLQTYGYYLDLEEALAPRDW